MSVQNGQPVNAQINNAANMSRLTDTSTVGKVALNNSDPASGASIANLQKAVNKAYEGVGAAGETDPSVNDYSSNNYIVDGDNRKVAIGKLDTQLKNTQDDLDLTEQDIIDLNASVTAVELDIVAINSSAHTFAGDKTFNNDVVIKGSLHVEGTTFSENQLEVTDTNISVNVGGNDVSSEGAGVTVERTGTKGSLAYEDALASKWKAGPLGSESEIITATHAQTLTNKTLTAPTISNPNVSTGTFTNPTLTSAIVDSLVMTEGSTPAAPASGKRKVYAKADGVYQIDSLGNESKVGTGSGSGGGVTNLIVDGDADGALSSIFVPYQNSSGARPTTGSGGVTTGITTSVSAVSPIVGAKSYLLTKDAANRQGGGWSIPFAVDLGYRAKVLKISTDYIVNSGTFVSGSAGVDSDVVWYIYDATNAQVIEPSSIKMLSNSTTLSDKFEATFQASATGASYLLIAHIATASASAYELKVDSVTVSPSTYVYGTPITDWMPYTSIITGCTAASVQFFYRRVGDSIDIKGNFIANSPNGSIATFSLPPGLTASAAKYGTVTGDYAGFGIKNNSSTNTRKRFSLQAVSGGTFIYYGSDDYAAGASPGSTITGSSIWNSGEAQAVFYPSLPITGFSSSVQMSDQADTRVVGGSYYGSGQYLADATWTTIKFATKLEDTAAIYNSTTGIGTIVTPGLYEFDSALAYGTGGYSTPAIFSARLQINGATNYGMGDVGFTAAANPNIPVGKIRLPMKSGDTFQIQGYKTNWGGSSGFDADGTKTKFSFVRISGPQAIAATDIIAMRSTNTSGQAVATGATAVLTGWTTSFDSHGAFNASTGIFTVSAAGFYRISALITPLSAAYTAGSARYHAIFLSGTAASTISLSGVQATTTAAYIAMQGSTLMYYKAGDTISLSWENNSGTSCSLLTSASSNWITIERIK